MKRQAVSTSRPVLALVAGPIRTGVALGAHHLRFGGYVVSLTRPGAPRMPNGVEVAFTARHGLPAAVGDGVIRVGDTSLLPGAEWDPVPSRLPIAASPTPAAGLLEEARSGPGPTPLSDDILAGYVAGLVLLHGRAREAEGLALRAALATTALSATLLLHAARGEVPEPVHRFLATGDPAGLLAFGHTSGGGWLAGLRLAGAPGGAAGGCQPERRSERGSGRPPALTRPD